MKEGDLLDSDLYEYRYRYKAKRSSVRFICILCAIVIAALCFRMYWTRTFGGVYVDGESMYPTLTTGDELLMKYGGDAERGDVIVVDVRRYGFEADTQDEYVCLDEPYAYYGTGVCDFGPYDVGENEIFFLGDNRMRSLDSRYKEDLSHLEDSLYTEEDIYGVVPGWSIKYKRILRWLPGLHAGI